MHLEDNHPTLGNEEVSLVTCTAAGSKPPAEVRWLTGTLADKVRATTSSTKHANGTTTTISTLLGVPTREINQCVIQCVITSAALSKEETLPFTTQVYCGYTNTSLLSVTSVVHLFVHCLFIHGYAGDHFNSTLCTTKNDKGVTSLTGESGRLLHRTLNLSVQVTAFCHSDACYVPVSSGFIQTVSSYQRG